MSTWLSLINQHSLEGQYMCLCDALTISLWSLAFFFFNVTKMNRSEVMEWGEKLEEVDAAQKAHGEEALLFICQG